MSFRVVEKPIPDQDARGVPDPRVLQLWLDAAQKPADAVPQTIETVRAGMGWPNLDLSQGVSTETRALPGRGGPINARLYRPAGKGPRGAIVFFHGGGFVGGGLTTVENPCRLLAQRSDAVVISVDYRLAPEHPFPAGLDDAWDAVKAVFANAAAWGIDPSRVAVAGDSAGANLAAGCCLLAAREGHKRPAVQLLIYPVVDQRRNERHLPWSEDAYEVSHPSERVLAAIRGDAAQRAWFTRLYLSGADATDELVSPILADPAAFPPTFVLTAEYDYLRIEGEEFARRLDEAGVPVRAVRYRGLDHAFFDKLGLFPQAADAVSEMARFFRGTASTDDRLKAQLAFLLEIDKLKLVQRRNELADASRRENTAEHSWHLVLFAMTLAEQSPGIDSAHAVRLVAVHDLVEIDAGDTFFWDTKGYEDKEDRERAAAKRLFGLLPADQAAEYEALWEEFEAAETPEAVFANAVDKLAPVLLNSHSGGRSWRENGITAAMVREKMTVIRKASPHLGDALETLIAKGEASGALVKA
jgi:acetyl esterase/lipase/5'-deoxynucleotidase YfbR-like HD superfamily hydrolase